MTGAALACALSESDYFEPGKNNKKKIVLLENQQIPQLNKYTSEAEADRIPEPRVITLSPNSIRFFNSIGAL